MLIKNNFTNVNFAQVKSVDLTCTFYLIHYIEMDTSFLNRNEEAYQFYSYPYSIVESRESGNLR